MRDYSTARTLFSFIEFVLWLGVVAGVIIAFATMGVASRGFGAPGILAAIPGIAITITSLFGIANTQMGRATVDTAEYGQQSLKVARDQLEVSRQSLKQGHGLQNSFAGLAQKFDPSSGAITNTDDMAATLEPKQSGYGALNSSEEASVTDGGIGDRQSARRLASGRNEPPVTLDGPKPYANQLGVNPASKQELLTYDINGKKLTQNPDGTFDFEGHSFASMDSVKEHLRLSSLSGRPRPRPL